MKRSLHLLLMLAACAPGAGWGAARASASDIHFGLSVAVPLPHGAIGITVGNAPYYYHHGSYYRHGYHGHGQGHGYAHGYYAVPPPMGACVPSIPSSYVGVVINGATYFHNGAIYYQVAPGGYRVSPPPPPTPTSANPAPAVAPSAPAPAPSPAIVLPANTDMTGYVQLRLKGRRYFYKSGVFFLKSSRGYASTAAPIGAVAQHLPDDSVSLQLGGQEYFESGSAVFKQTRDGFMLLDG